MKIRYTAIAMLTLLTSACTIEPDKQGLRSEFHPPFTYHNWQQKQYTLPSGHEVCAVTSGYSGLTVYLVKRDGTIDTAVSGNVTLRPGAAMTVTVDGDRYSSYDEFFPPETAKQIVASLEKGTKAYIEWETYSRTNGGANLRGQNVIKLGGFTQQLQQCRDALK
ncbi:MAG TPA: hypothetical protein VFT64_11575 [Rickettsiales bacterium]|nr:hypothetical protein [Rickettsiales bacterium]